ncbi:MAG: 50S ribosomal protein L15 [Gammaproteobacteria bacterium]|jgi:large subunit ribosomal protein L15|nr:50S ribosomal protein L15 [Gammaproteobacteria bacterium]|tara:strand:+ start:108 stop:599 length:492 start_codon:yes stop_codon:yes gene_type:complete
MELNKLSPASGSTKTKKRVGRGVASGWGKTCGSGHKGQKSRSGGKVKPGFEGGQMPLQMRLPKYGFTSRIGQVTSEVRTSELNKVEGGNISIETLKKSGVITSGTKRVKIMLSGKVDKKLTIQGLPVSKGAREAIEKAGGEIFDSEVDRSFKTVEQKEPENQG